MSPPRLSRIGFLARLLMLAIAHAALAKAALAWFSFEPGYGLFWPASGLALAALLLGGPRYAWGPMLGTLGISLVQGQSWATSLVFAFGTVAEALLGYALIHGALKRRSVGTSLNTYFHVQLLAGAAAASVNAVVGASVLLVLGREELHQFWYTAMHWWMGDLLGIALVTPLVLVWRHGFPPGLQVHQRITAAGVLTASLLAGQVIFMGWMSVELDMVSRQGYWMFFFVTWTATRLGSRGVVLVLCAAAVQAFLGARAGVGFFSDDVALHRPSNVWFYLMCLTLVGMSLSTYLAQLRRLGQELRIAAIAFETQTGMAVLDAQRCVLRINRAFTRITGFDARDVVGQQVGALVSGAGVEPETREALWAAAAQIGGAQYELSHRHRNGSTFPALVTITAVKDATQRITHYVATVTSTAQARQQEQQRLAHEAMHRDALVREVHHRIKNNLQGITGLLRQWAHRHPETAVLINQAIAQVQGIALVHGLQGQWDPHAVQLDRLIRAIANEIGSLWRTHIEVDIEPSCAALTLSEQEAVPMALVLNELILNAIKHGGQRPNATHVSLRTSTEPTQVCIAIRNPGQLGQTTVTSHPTHTGLQLVRALLPRSGVQWTQEQQGSEVLTQLKIGPPIIKTTRKESHDHATTTANPAPDAGG